MIISLTQAALMSAFLCYPDTVGLWTLLLSHTKCFCCNARLLTSTARKMMKRT